MNTNFISAKKNTAAADAFVLAYNEATHNQHTAFFRIYKVESL